MQSIGDAHLKQFLITGLLQVLGSFLKWVVKKFTARHSKVHLNKIHLKKRAGHILRGGLNTT